MSITVSRSIRVRRPVGEVFALWADFENFPKFMSSVASVRRVGEGLTRWTYKGPGGILMEWNAKTTEQTPNRRIAWRTLTDGECSAAKQAGVERTEAERAGVSHTGEVLFQDLGDETDVTVTMTYELPFGPLGQWAGQVLINPQGRLDRTLENFRRYCEKDAPLRKTA